MGGDDVEVDMITWHQIHVNNYQPDRRQVVVEQLLRLYQSYRSCPRSQIRRCNMRLWRQPGDYKHVWHQLECILENDMNPLTSGASTE